MDVVKCVSLIDDNQRQSEEVWWNYYERFCHMKICDFEMILSMNIECYIYMIEESSICCVKNE